MTGQQPATSNKTLYLPPRKCAAEIGVPEYTVRQWLANGFIKGVPCGQRKVLINVELLRRKLEEI